MLFSQMMITLIDEYQNNEHELKLIGIDDIDGLFCIVNVIGHHQQHHIPSQTTTTDDGQK